MVLIAKRMRSQPQMALYDGSGLVKNSIKILTVYPVGRLMFESSHSKPVKKNILYFGTNKLYSIYLATFIVNEIS